MTNRQKVHEIKHLKSLQAENLEAVHTHTHTLYVYQIDRKLNKSNIKNRRKNL